MRPDLSAAFRLTPPQSSRHPQTAPAKSGVGFSSPSNVGAQAPIVRCRRFFHARSSAMGVHPASLRRAARGHRKVCRSYVRSANPASSVTSNSSAVADSNSRRSRLS